MAFDCAHRQPGKRRHRRVIGQIVPAVGGGLSVGGKERLEWETLRRLRGRELLARNGRGDRARLDPLDSLGDRQHGDRTVFRVAGVDHTVDRIRAHERARGIVDQDDLRRTDLQRLEPIEHRFLTRRTPDHRRKKAPKPVHSMLISRLVAFAYHDQNRVHPLMREETFDGAAEHRLVADFSILLRQLETGATAATAGDDQRSDAAGTGCGRFLHVLPQRKMRAHNTGALRASPLARSGRMSILQAKLQVLFF